MKFFRFQFFEQILNIAAATDMLNNHRDIRN